MAANGALVQWTERRIAERACRIGAPPASLLDDDPVQLYQHGVGLVRQITALQDVIRTARLDSERWEARRQTSACSSKLLDIDHKLHELGYSQPGTCTPQDRVPSY